MKQIDVKCEPTCFSLGPSFELDPHREINELIDINEATWCCHEPTCLCLEPLFDLSPLTFDLDPCDLWPLRHMSKKLLNPNGSQDNELFTGERNRSSLCTMMYNAGRWCTTQVNGEQRNSVPLNRCATNVPQTHAERQTDRQMESNAKYVDVDTNRRYPSAVKWAST